MSEMKRIERMSTKQKICGGISVIVGMAILIPIVLSFGEGGRPLGLGQGLVVIVASYIFFAIGVAIGSAFHRNGKAGSGSK